MGKLTRDDILKLAQLARLSVTDEEITEYESELSAILDYVEKLDDISVEGLKPTHQVTGLASVTRADEIIDYGYAPAALLENVPAIQDGQIKVKRMIG